MLRVIVCYEHHKRRRSVSQNLCYRALETSQDTEICVLIFVLSSVINTISHTDLHLKLRVIVH
jgi:hypothetical protein